MKNFFWILIRNFDCVILVNVDPFPPLLKYLGFYHKSRAELVDR